MGIAVKLFSTYTLNDIKCEVIINWNR